jgi:hypothetical protein
MVVSCKGCGKPIQWIEMASGKKMPVDAEPVTAVRIEDGKGVVTKVFTPHWATCPKGADFRKEKGGP